MNAGSETNDFSSSLSSGQIEILQHQIRQFKSLGKRFNESRLPKIIEEVNNRANDQTSVKVLPKQVEHEVPVPALSWQCFNALLFYGPPKSPQDGAISFASSDIGCFSKGAHLPLVLTTPYVAALRETTLHKFGGITDSSVVSTSSSGSLHLQREARSQLASAHMEHISSSSQQSTGTSGSAPATLHPPSSYGQGNYLSELLPFRSYYRTRKQTRRDVKAAEKEEKRRKAEADDRRKKRCAEFSKSVLLHREDFFRFHKAKRGECSKTARLVKLWVENVDAKKEKDEARAEVRRLQALKENDMEAYAALVADTRNGRLKFLLNETDSYIATINKMIQDQRTTEEMEDGAAAAAGETAGAVAVAVAAASGSVNAVESEMARDSTSGGGGAASEGAVVAKNRMTQATKDYYRSTHRAVETVSQPRMMQGGDLKEYQLSGLQWMVSLYNNNLNGILADEMGLGKTIQTIALLCYLMEFKHNNGPFLVVVPLSTLSNWVNEFNRWAPTILKVVYKGAPEERKRLFRDEVEGGALNVLLTTYEYIMKDKGQLRKLHWQYIIVDEGHRMKNAQSKFAQTLGTVYQSRHRILLTGTPLQNNLPELWALLNFLLPTIFSSVDTFDQWFNKPFTAFRTQGPQADAEGGEVAVLSQEERMLIVHRLHEVLRPFMLRRVKDQVLDQLPEKVEKVLRCNLSGWQRKMYHSISMKGLSVKEGGAGGAGGGGGLNNTIMQLRKVCNHPYLFMRDYAVDEDLVRASGKFELLDRMLPKLKAAGHRVLLFSQMVELMNFLEQFFLLRGFQYLRLDGNTSSEEREKRMYQFNDPDSPYFIFLLSTRAGGLGLNLATADTVIIFDSDWNPMMDAQAQDRAHRIGQKNEVRVFRLLTNSPIEERILSRANDKRNLTGLVVEAGKFNAKTAGASALQENKELMESMLNEWSTGGGAPGAGGDGDEEDDLPDDEAINEMMASYEGEMELYTAMDAQRAQKKAAHWAHMHSVARASDAPPLPARLMEAAEKPYWMTPECWPTKYSVLMADMMTTAPPPPPAKKKGRKKKGESGSSVSFAQQHAEGASESDDDEEPDEGEGGYDTHSVSASMTSGGFDSQGGGGQQNLVGGFAMRQRKEVQYDDHMTDLQFSRFIDKQTDADMAAAPSVMAAAAATKAAKKAAKAAGGGEDGEVGSAVHKDLLKVLRDLQKIKRTDGAPGHLAELFKEKPPRAIYPDYYALIETPIALKDVAARLRKAPGSAGAYRFLEEVEADLALMSHNARTYNLDSSPVFQDCEALRRAFADKCAALRAKYGFPPAPIHSATGSTMVPLPSIGYQIYESPRAYRCELSQAQRQAGSVADNVSVDLSVASSSRDERKPPVAVKRKAAGDGAATGDGPKKRKYTKSGGAAPLTEQSLSSHSESFQNQLPKSGVRFPVPSPYALGGGGGQGLAHSSSSLSLSLKRNQQSAAAAAETASNGDGVDEDDDDGNNGDSGGLVLSFNLKSLKQQQSKRA